MITKHVNDLIAEFKSLGNPFLVDESSTELIQMGSRDVMPEGAIRTVRNIEDITQKQLKEFRESRIIKHVTPVEAPIKKNKQMVFKTCNTKGPTRSKSEEKELKLHVRLFSQMYISTQIRGGDMIEFFSHETLKVPPSLSKNGEMRSETKADLLKCFNLEPFNDFQTKKPKVDAACL